MSASPSPGVAKIVQLDGKTVLAIEVKNGDSLPEGEYSIQSISVTSGPTGEKPDAAIMDNHFVCIVQAIWTF